MRQKQSPLPKKVAILSVLAMSLVVGTGCSLFNTDSTSSPTDASQGATAGQEQAKNVMPTTIYATDANGFVVPLNIKMGQTNEVAKKTLELMVKGSAGDASLTGTGLQNILPKGTEVRGVTINEGIAKVDFNKNFLNYESELQEQQIVDAVVWTLTSFENVKGVQFMIEGRNQATLKKGTPLAGVITRDNGINLQVAKNINPSNSTKVTLYFTGANPSGDFSYLVPVTRIIPKELDKNIADLTMSELAKGPNTSGLQQVVTETLKPKTVELKDKLAKLDFGDDFTVAGDTAQGKNMINSIVLSLAANTGVSQIQFTVNGKAPAAGKSLDLTKPVSLPQVINQKTL